MWIGYMNPLRHSVKGYLFHLKFSTSMLFPLSIQIKLGLFLPTRVILLHFYQLQTPLVYFKHLIFNLCYNQLTNVFVSNSLFPISPHIHLKIQCVNGETENLALPIIKSSALAVWVGPYICVLVKVSNSKFWYYFLQVPNMWGEDELHNVVQMGFNSSAPLDSQELNGMTD